MPRFLLLITAVSCALLGASASVATAVIQSPAVGTWSDAFADASGIAQQTNVAANPATGHLGLVNTPTTNLLINSSFGVNSPSFPQAADWGRADGFGLDITQEGVVNGQDPLLYSAGRAYRFTIGSATAANGYAYIAQGLILKPNTTYSLSATAANFARNLSSAVFIQNLSSDSHAFESYGAISWAVGEEGHKSATFTTPSYVTHGRVGFSLNVGSNLDVVGYAQIGSLQLEENVFPTAYADGSLGAGYSFNDLETPAAPAVTASATGGILPAGTYCYAATASNSNGETTAGPATCASTTGTTSSIVVDELPVSGSTFISLYGRTAGAGLGLLHATSISQRGGLTPVSYTDTGSAAPGMAPPATSTAAAVANLSPSTRTIAAPFYRTDVSGSLTSSSINPPTLSGWMNANWTAEPNGQSLKIQVVDGSGTVIPDTALPGNGAGFSSAPIDLSALSSTAYPAIALKAILSTTNSSVTPFLDGWSVAWNPVLPTSPPSPSPSPSSLPLAVTAINGTPVDTARSMTWNLATSRPIFTGIAPAGSTVRVTVHSNPMTCTTTADSTGHWSCTLGTDIPTGNHTVLVSATTPQGQLLSLASFPLTISPSLAATGARTEVPTVAGLLLALMSAAGMTTARRRHP